MLGNAWWVFLIFLFFLAAAAAAAAAATAIAAATAAAAAAAAAPAVYIGFVLNLHAGSFPFSYFSVVWPASIGCHTSLCFTGP